MTSFWGPQSGCAVCCFASIAVTAIWARKGVRNGAPSTRMLTRLRTAGVRNRGAQPPARWGRAATPALPRSTRDVLGPPTLKTWGCS